MKCVLDDSVECNESCTMKDACPLDDFLPCGRGCDGECQRGLTCPYEE